MGEEACGYFANKINVFFYDSFTTHTAGGFPDNELERHDFPPHLDHVRKITRKRKRFKNKRVRGKFNDGKACISLDSF